jgi:hypothetical protein
MKHLKMLGVFVLCMVLGAGCAQLPLQQREVMVPVGKLNEALSRRLENEKKILEIFSLKLGQPRLVTEPATQRLRADFGVTLSHPFSNRPLTGRTAISGAIGYDATSRSVMLLEPRIESLELDAVPPALRDVTARLAAALGRELLGHYPLVSVQQKDLSALGRDYRVAGFEVVEEGVRVTLRATD